MRGLQAAVAVAALAIAGGTAAPIREEERGKFFPGGVPRDPMDRDPIPDRVSLEQDSPYFFEGYPMLGVVVNGRKSDQVVEFCVSEGWARLCQRNHRGKMKRGQDGRPITVTVHGSIQPHWRDVPIPDVAIVRSVAEVMEERKPKGERPAVSREVARRLRQQAAREAKAAARRE